MPFLRAGYWLHPNSYPTDHLWTQPPELSFVFGYSPSLRKTKTPPLPKTEKPGKREPAKGVALAGFLPKEVGSLSHATSIDCVLAMCQVLGSHEESGTSSYVIRTYILERAVHKGQNPLRRQWVNCGRLPVLSHRSL